MMVSNYTYWNSITSPRLGKGESPELNIASLEKASSLLGSMGAKGQRYVFTEKAILLKTQSDLVANVRPHQGPYRVRDVDGHYGNAGGHSNRRQRVTYNHYKG